MLFALEEVCDRVIRDWDATYSLPDKVEDFNRDVSLAEDMPAAIEELRKLLATLPRRKK